MKFSKRKTVAILAYMLLVSHAITAPRVRRKRRYAVRPMNRNRRMFGHCHNLVMFMKQYDHEQFFKYTRMTPALFDYLVTLVDPHLRKHPHRNALTTSERLIITLLHYLAEGCSQQQIAWDMYLGKTTVHHVIIETCEALWNVLSPMYLPAPTQDAFANIAEGFFKRWNMPNCIGAVDGKHVIIQAPQHSGSEFFSYKKTFSIVLMATCDAFYKFSMVDIGSAGSNHDSHVFKLSAFGEALMKGQLPLPPNKPLPNSDVTLPHFLVGDQAFPLHRNIMRPYPGTHLGQQKNIFNYRLSRARRTIENAFGILAQRWRILRKPIIAQRSTCESIVKAAVILHNFVQKSEEDLPECERKYCPTGYADYEDELGHVHPGQWRDETTNLRPVGRVDANNAGQSIQQNRDLLSEYFVSPTGGLPWQEDHVLIGSVPV